MVLFYFDFFDWQACQKLRICLETERGKAIWGSRLVKTIVPRKKKYASALKKHLTTTLKNATRHYV